MRNYWILMSWSLTKRSSSSSSSWKMTKTRMMTKRQRMKRRTVACSRFRVHLVGSSPRFRQRTDCQQSADQEP